MGDHKSSDCKLQLATIFLIVSVVLVILCLFVFKHEAHQRWLHIGLVVSMLLTILNLLRIVKPSKTKNNNCELCSKCQNESQ